METLEATPELLAAQSARTNRRIVLEAMPKARLVALHAETMKRLGWRLVMGSPAKWSKHELANEIATYEEQAAAKGAAQ